MYDTFDNGCILALTKRGKKRADCAQYPRNFNRTNIKKMKRIASILSIAALFALCGCGANVNENQTPEQAKTQAASMDAAALQKQVDALKAYIEKKTAQAKEAAEKLSKIPLTEQMGKDAQALRDEAAKISESLKNIQAQLSVYAQELKAKAQSENK